ncbi:hypothetical protein ERJ75_000490000 [Trypanosoma vivax]|nr:hypothetical protein TRVL_08328 [Trypanosoma vivax]KAH8616336.1 hypothetical protein ERJ75_000490000 [Trypanosoma vivax]
MLSLSTGALYQKHSRRTRTAARCVVISGADATKVRRVVAKMAACEQPTALAMHTPEKMPRPYGVAAHPIKRCAGACGHGGDRTLFWCENSDAAGETRGPTGALGRHFEQLREVDGTHAEDARGMAKLPCVPPKTVGKDKASRPPFNGHVVLRRTRITGAATEEGQQRLPLQKVDVWTLSLEWVNRRLDAMKAVCSSRRNRVHQNANRS